ncbi:MAG: M20/M25/M40 family metallo-hydrolase [Sedimentisphaerales bacterium]|nr:M20/M25/M40 family metallo-hydrolase [Sedimentisphaerales bacterium]
MRDRAIAFIEANRDRFLRELLEFLRFPSVSSQSAHQDDVVACARWLKDHLEGIGVEARLIEMHGHPIVEARGKERSGRRLIVYGHYDVQPADASDGWESPPFEPRVREGFIRGRGASDDKGPLFAHVKAVESLIATAGKLPCDVRFLVEGEEESGGDSLKKYVEAEKVRLAPEAVVISDTTMYDERTPATTYALRGLVGLELTVRVAGRDLHSGAYGGAVGNPGLALARILDACMGPDGKVRVPGFYEGIRPLEEWEKDSLLKLGFDEKTVLDETGARDLRGSRPLRARADLGAADVRCQWSVWRLHRQGDEDDHPGFRDR